MSTDIMQGWKLIDKQKYSGVTTECNIQEAARDESNCLKELWKSVNCKMLSTYVVLSPDSCLGRINYKNGLLHKTAPLSQRRGTSANLPLRV